MIVTLTQQEIDEYDKQYDASMLVAGAPVFFDGEMYFTSGEVEEAIWRIESDLHKWGDPLLSDMQEELARLKAALSSFEKPQD